MFSKTFSNYDTKTCKNGKIIHWVLFNIHKDPQNNYKYFYYYLNIFNLKNEASWKDSYMI